MTHPLNPKHDHCFDFAQQFVHARYVQSGQPIFDNEFDDSEDELETPKTEMQAVGSRYQTRKEKKEKKDSKSKKKLFQYGKRGAMIPVDSDESSEDDYRNRRVDDDEEESESESDSDDEEAGNNIKISAVSIDAAMDTLKGS